MGRRILLFNNQLILTFDENWNLIAASWTNMIRSSLFVSILKHRLYLPNQVLKINNADLSGWRGFELVWKTREPCRQPFSPAFSFTIFPLFLSFSSLLFFFFFSFFFFVGGDKKKFICGPASLRTSSGISGGSTVIHQVLYRNVAPLQSVLYKKMCRCFFFSYFLPILATLVFPFHIEGLKSGLLNMSC